MKVSRFLLTATACGGLLAGFLQFVQPAGWFTPPAATAVVEVRVVPRFAPTAASVRQTILSDTFLNSAWHRFHNIGTSVAEPTDTETPEAAAKRQAQLTHWRERLDVEIEPHFVDDQRQIRIRCAAGDDIASAGEMAQFLAVRYAGELAATRWYDAVDRLRVSQQQYRTSGDQLLTIIHQAVAANKSADLRDPFADAKSIWTVASTEEESIAPRLIAPNQIAEPAADVGPKVSKPSAIKQIPLLAEAPVERTTIAGFETEKLVQVERQFLTAGGAMERQLADMLAPQSAEFPVVATEIEGLHLGHVPGFWYAVAAAVGLAFATVVERMRTKGDAVRHGAPAASLPTNSPSRYVEPQPAAATVELPSTPAVIRTPEEAVQAVRAPLIGVVRRSAV